MQGNSGEDLVGVDVSKAWIDVCLSGSRHVERVANTPEALAAWIARARVSIGAETDPRIGVQKEPLG